MGLLERVRRLVRANLNDLIDRAEEPEKMLRQVLLDMQNQLMQVKTQVAIAVADQHLLEKKRVENEQASADLLRILCAIYQIVQVRTHQTAHTFEQAHCYLLTRLRRV